MNNNNRCRCINNCTSPLVNENERIKSLKPALLMSLFILMVIIFLDYYLFETYIYYYLSLIVLPIFLMILKRFYFIYTFYSVFFIFLVIPKIINDLGTYFQVETITTTRKVIFCLKLLCLILLCMVYYIVFLYYKELKYLYIKEKKNIPGNMLINGDENI